MLISFVVLLFGISWNVVSLSLFFLDEIVGLLECTDEIGLESIVSFGSGGERCLFGLGFIALLDSSLSLGVSISLLLGEKYFLLGSKWVESVSNGGISEWVLLGLIVRSDVNSWLSKLGLNLIGVDDSSKISTGHDGSVKVISALLGGSISGGSENLVQGFESRFGEDDESTEMTSWGELEDVKSMDIADVDTWEISSGSLELITSFVVDDKWSLSHDILGVSISTVTLSDLLGVSNLGEIVTGSDGVENSDERFGVWLGEVVDDEWELWDVVNVMSSCHDKRSDSGGSKSSCDGMSSLGNVNLSVDCSPDLEWSEHSGLSAHVTECGLSSS